MLKITQNSEGNKNLIIFIHGFIGGESTWVKDGSTNSFIGYLFFDKDIADNFDYAIFSYHTKLIEIFSTFRRQFKKLIHKQKATKNLPINDIADILGTEVRVKCKDYNQIVLVGHSMGGLVAKRFLLNQITKTETSKVIMYVSLATPHSGTHLATYGSQIIQNYQVEDLNPLSDNINQLNREWVQCTSLPKKRIYFQGKSDEVVPQVSAIALDRDNIEPYYSDDDHFSIIVPDHKDDIVIAALQGELKELIKKKMGA